MFLLFVNLHVSLSALVRSQDLYVSKTVKQHRKTTWKCESEVGTITHTKETARQATGDRREERRRECRGFRISRAVHTKG